MVNKGNKPPAGGRVADPLPIATVSLAEAARVLGIGTSTAYRLAEAGELAPGIPVRRIGGTRKVLRADLERWAAGELPATG